MPRRFPKPCLFITVCALMFFAHMTPTTARAQPAEEWIRLSSKHFDMLTCGSQPEAERLLVGLEQFRAAFFSLFPQKRTHYKRPCIVVVESPEQLGSYLPLHKGKIRKNLAGVFMDSPFGARIIMVQQSSPYGVSASLHTIYHEYVHSLVAAMGLRPPLYLNEGLAEVYATFTTGKEGGIIGRANRRHIELLRVEKWLPIPALFAVDHKSKYYTETNHANVFYAQSWLLAHYMIFGNNDDRVTLKKLDVFLDLCETPGLPMADAFKQAFGMDYAQLERALRDYRKRGSYTTVTSTVPTKSIRKQITAKPANPLERDIELAAFKWRGRQSIEAEFLLLQLLEKNPKNPRVYEILAEIKSYQREIPAADDHWARAVENNSFNPMAYISLLRSFYRKSELPLRYIMPDAMCAEYRRLVDRALELAPDSMEAHELLAIIESQSPQIRAGEMNRVLSALSSMRERTITYLALAVAYWRLKQYKSAEAVIKALSADPKATHAQKRMARDVLREVAKETGREIPPPLPGENPERRFKIEPDPSGR